MDGGATTEPEPASPAPAEAAKRVEWAELFFDLVFVFAITQVASVVDDNRTLIGLTRAVVVLVPLYWTWVGTAIQTNLRDIAAPSLRLMVFVIGLTSFLMAIVLPHAFGGAGLIFALGYWVGRLVMGWQTLANLVRGRRPDGDPYSVAMFVSGPLLVVGAEVPSGLRLGIWGLAALLDLSTPALFRRRLRQLRLNPAHLAERFGLLLLIALGESVVAIGSTADLHGIPDTSRGFAVGVAFAASCALWWVYFHFAADAVRFSLGTARLQIDVIRTVLSYGHLLFIVGIIGATVGFRDAVATPTHSLALSADVLLFGGVALYLATFGITRWSMFHQLSWTRLTGAAATICCGAIGLDLPGLGSLALVTAVLVALNGTEYAIVRRRES